MKPHIPPPGEVYRLCTTGHNGLGPDPYRHAIDTPVKGLRLCVVVLHLA